MVGNKVLCLLIGIIHAKSSGESVVHLLLHCSMAQNIRSFVFAYLV